MAALRFPVIIAVLFIVVWVPWSQSLFAMDASDTVHGHDQPHRRSKQVIKWAILIAGSSGHRYYRHQADVCHAYHVLRRGGLDDNHIIVFMNDDLTRNQKNPFIMNRPNGPNVYAGVPKDYTGKYVTASNLYNVMLGDESSLTGGSGKVLKSDRNDHVFIYYSGHGATRGLLSMPNGDGIHAHELVRVLKRMHQSKLYGQMVIYVEACFSGSMFEGHLPRNLNIYVTTAANPHEESYGCYWSQKLGTYLGDRYSVSWMEDSESHDLMNETLKQQFYRVRIRTLNKTEWKDDNVSHVMVYGTKKIGDQTLSNFLGSSERKRIAAEEIFIGTDHHKSLSKESSEEMYAAREKFEAEEISLRQNASRNMEMIIYKLFGSGSNSTKVVEDRRQAGKPIVDNWYCLEIMIKSYKARCGKIPTCIWKYSHAIANMCNAGISPRRFGNAASEVCGK